MELRSPDAPAYGTVRWAFLNMVMFQSYPLVMTNIAMENHHFNGKTHYKWSFSIAMLVYQSFVGSFTAKMGKYDDQ